MLPAPRLSFACELDPARLADLFTDAAVIDDLLALLGRVGSAVTHARGGLAWPGQAKLDWVLYAIAFFWPSRVVAWLA
jgi:hypothetical protein